jgi:hypothetical protein
MAGWNFAEIFREVAMAIPDAPALVQGPPSILVTLEFIRIVIWPAAFQLPDTHRLMTAMAQWIAMVTEHM